jgi:CysZ protein
LLKELIIAFQSYYDAHRFIVKNRLWKWILVPGIIYTLLFCLGVYLFIKSDNMVIAWILKVSHLTTWIDKIQNGMLQFLFTFASVILYLILFLFYFSLFKYIVLILGSPVFAYLSEKTEAILEGRNYPFSFRQLVKDFSRGISIALRNTLWQTVYTVSIILLSFIPLIGWATPVLAILVDCYYYGFSMLDYSSERRNMNTAESIYFINTHKGLAIGNGIVFYLMHIVPVLGWIPAPAYAIVAATLSMRKVTPLNETAVI